MSYIFRVTTPTLMVHKSFTSIATYQRNWVCCCLEQCVHLPLDWLTECYLAGLQVRGNKVETIWVYTYQQLQTRSKPLKLWQFSCMNLWRPRFNLHSSPTWHTCSLWLLLVIPSHQPQICTGVLEHSGKSMG